MAGKSAFVTVGTTKFDGLVEAVDTPSFAGALMQQGFTKLTVQAGRGLYEPRRLLTAASTPGPVRDNSDSQDVDRREAILLPADVEDGSNLAPKDHVESLHVVFFAYSPNLAAHVAEADLVVSHAGAGSAFEALSAGKPLIVVPNPTLMHNHQVELAEELQRRGHAVATTAEDLVGALERLAATKLVPYAGGDVSGLARVVAGAVSPGKGHRAAEGLLAAAVYCFGAVIAGLIAHELVRGIR
ncbi:unnamed protein product [Pedinophyceae sp. YPF-701]|nr:unnamed protein product [Pedinophyceae sp. YPF-701]